MGRTSRWLASLLGWKKSENNSSSNNAIKQKKWRFGKSYRETKAKDLVIEERRGSYREEENKRAIAVAEATQAVAEAAVAAAQAAAEVVKLTRGGDRSMRGGREDWAAIMIQAVFRGYLARRALRALKGLVKLQALARGNIVRKQVAETLRCMHALVRVQARARACRALKSEQGPLDKPPRSNGPRSQRSASVKRSSRNHNGQTGFHDRSKSAGWNWMDIEDKYSDDEKNTKILEIDPGKPSNSKPTPKKPHHQHQQNRSHYMMASSYSTLTQPDSPSRDSTTAQLSVPSPSTIDMAESSFYPNYQISYEESPYYSVTSRPGSSKRGGFTPAKSEYIGSYTVYGGCTDYYPNYMTNTQSSSAKVRSQSAPKQRPEQFEKLGSVKKVANNLQLKFASKGYPGSGRLDRLGMPIGY